MTNIIWFNLIICAMVVTNVCTASPSIIKWNNAPVRAKPPNTRNDYNMNDNHIITMTVMDDNDDDDDDDDNDDDDDDDDNDDVIMTFFGWWLYGTISCFLRSHKSTYGVIHLYTYICVSLCIANYYNWNVVLTYTRYTFERCGEMMAVQLPLHFSCEYLQYTVGILNYSCQWPLPKLW